MRCVRLKTFLTPIVIFITTSLIAFVSSAEETTRDNWTITLGLGVFHGPEYMGSDDAETMLSPNFEVGWKDKVFLNPDGISINYYRNDSIVLNAIVSQGDEREESLSTNLNGLGNIDTSTTLTLGAEIDLGLFISRANLTRHIGGTDGTQAIFGIETVIPLRMLTGKLNIESMAETEDLTLIGPLIIAGVSADWADDDYTRDFFGVNAEQSADSGLPLHTAESGFESVNLELGVLYPVSKSWIVHGLAGYTKLIGDAKDSPVVKANDYIFIGALINYQF